MRAQMDLLLWNVYFCDTYRVNFVWHISCFYILRPCDLDIWPFELNVMSPKSTLAICTIAPYKPIFNFTS